MTTSTPADGVNNTNEYAEVYKQKTKRVYEPYYLTPSDSESLTEVTFKEGIPIHDPFSDDKSLMVKDQILAHLSTGCFVLINL